jgi:twitching motility protein PilT
MDDLLRYAVGCGASDIHLKTGDVVRARIDGSLVPISQQALGADQVRAVAQRVVGDRRVREALEGVREYDCSYGVAELGRFRVNLLRQRGSLMMVLRIIPVEIPDFETLRLPPVIEKIAQLERGMVVVTGVTGSGKSSTQAAVIEFLNRRVRKHVITLENPIEFLFNDKLCSITQREVGPDTEDFAAGLRSAMRQDPDMILIGEMRDAETMDIALKAAETGHLVLSTLHTPDAVSTVHRMLAVFPPLEQRSVRIRLAESLQAVVSQRLLPAKSGRGRVLACEILMATAAVREKIAQERPFEEIRDLMEAGGEQYGSQSFDQHLARLVREDLVSFETAVAASTNPSDFQLRFKFDARGGDVSADAFLGAGLAG